MSRQPRFPLLAVVAILVAWHGLVQMAPHDHADGAVPQERLGCAASRPSSQESHLHGAGARLHHHPCLACLAGSTTAVPTDVGTLHGPWAENDGAVSATRTVRLQPPVHLPLLRGPPAVV